MNIVMNTGTPSPKPIANTLFNTSSSDFSTAKTSYGGFGFENAMKRTHASMRAIPSKNLILSLSRKKQKKIRQMRTT